uniref:Uncharacterized protein n=1 Tax=Romanomermis culicivorax TaxID=13658 RepID=A0A915K4S6_ROMCU
MKSESVEADIGGPILPYVYLTDEDDRTFFGNFLLLFWHQNSSPTVSWPSFNTLTLQYDVLLAPLSVF